MGWHVLKVVFSLYLSEKAQVNSNPQPRLGAGSTLKAAFSLGGLGSRKPFPGAVSALLNLCSPQRNRISPKTALAVACGAHSVGGFLLGPQSGASWELPGSGPASESGQAPFPWDRGQRKGQGR